MVRKILAVIIPAILAAQAATAGGGRMFVENLFVEDSEDAEQRAHLFGYRFSPEFVRDDVLAASVGRWTFDDPVGSEDFDALRLTYDLPLAEATRLKLRATHLSGDGWSPTLGGFALAHDYGSRWHFELNADRELVDSVPGIRQELFIDSIGGSADYRVSPQWTVVGAVFRQSIDDGNDRTGGVLRLIWSVSAIPGLTLQSKSRYVESDFDGNDYFSPPELEEHLLLAGYSRAVAGDRWVVSVLAGPGRQRFEDDFGNATRNDLFYGELKARGWFTANFGLEARAFCSNTGGPTAGAPDDDYRYCSALVSLLLAR